MKKTNRSVREKPLVPKTKPTKLEPTYTRSDFFGDPVSINLDFGPSVSHELPPDYPEPYYDDAPDKVSKGNPTMSNALKPSRTDILTEALANAVPRPSRAKSHLSILNEDQWKLLHDSKVAGSLSNPKIGLQQLFDSMDRAYRDNDEAFFKDFAQFYNTYRVASKLLGFAPVKKTKAPE